MEYEIREIAVEIEAADPGLFTTRKDVVAVKATAQARLMRGSTVEYTRYGISATYDRAAENASVDAVKGVREMVAGLKRAAERGFAPREGERGYAAAVGMIRGGFPYWKDVKRTLDGEDEDGPEGNLRKLWEDRQRVFAVSEETA